jgi:hypothetical protein
MSLRAEKHVADSANSVAIGLKSRSMAGVNQNRMATSLPFPCCVVMS